MLASTHQGRVALAHGGQEALQVALAALLADGFVEGNDLQLPRRRGRHIHVSTHRSTSCQQQP